jgi:hypothetical protein
MTTTANKAQKKVSETYRHPLERSMVALRYFEDDSASAPRRYVVVRTGIADEPIVYRHATIEDARTTWKRLRSLLKSEGYERIR